MNEIVEFADNKSVKKIKDLIGKNKVSHDDTNRIVEMLDASPTILNHLSLEEISKLSVLGVDLSRYMTAVHINNIKVFVVKFASDSMMRVSKLITLLNKVEEKYYNLALSNNYIHPKVASDMIEKIQESITASVNLMMKLTDNETLMNLFIVNMNTINAEISENKAKGYTNTVDILPLESRKKIDKVVTLLVSALNERQDEPKLVEAEFIEKEGDT